MDLRTISLILSSAALGGLLVASVLPARPVGNVPFAGPQAVDGTWLLGLAGGVNSGYISGITAAGTNQATATAMPAGYWLNEADTVPSSSGVALPICAQGTQLSFYNNGASNVIVYPNANNNPSTSAQDTINNSTSVTVNAHTSELFFCAKSGVWGAK